MRPSPGDIVLYHFDAYVRHGSPDKETRTRPAIVQSVYPDPNVPQKYPGGILVNLFVFAEISDMLGWQCTPFTAINAGGSIYEPISHPFDKRNVEGVPAHVAETDGMFEPVLGLRRTTSSRFFTPDPGTWSWPEEG